MSSVWVTTSPSMVTTGAGALLVVVVRAASRSISSDVSTWAIALAWRSMNVLNRRPLDTNPFKKEPVVCSAPATMWAAADLDGPIAAQ